MATTTRIALADCPKDWQKDSQYLYIGDEDKRCGLTRPHPWLTTNAIIQRPGEDRGAYLDRYETVLLNGIEYDTNLRDFLVRKHGRTLVCQCPPNQLCHGLVLCHVIDMAAARQYATDSIVTMSRTDSWRKAEDSQVRKLTLMRSEEEDVVAQRAAQFREDIYLFPPRPNDINSMRGFFEAAHAITNPSMTNRVSR